MEKEKQFVREMTAENMGKKPGEKSNFKVTCNLLSQYLKEKGSLGGLGLEMASRSLDQQATEGNFRTPTTMSLLPGVKVAEEDDQNEDNTTQNAQKSMDLFPQNAGLDCKEESIDPSTIKELEKAQLTIFYGGKVLVFDDFPANKAKDLMQMASKESIAAQSFAFPAPPSTPVAEPPPSRPNSVLPSTSGNQSPAPPEKPPTEAIASDMPIARRNSLHRFLEKRKDRINTKAPYQLHGGSPPPAAAAKQEGSKSWLGLGREVSKPENSSGSSR